MNLENEFGCIGYKRSGYGCGDIDFSIRPYEISKLTPTGLKELDTTLKRFYRLMSDDIYEARYKRKRYRIFGLGFLKNLFRNDAIYKFWPVSFGIKPGIIPCNPFFDAHGWQIGHTNNKNVYAWALHIGRFLVKFGKQK